ncbi:sigma factor-like helix-turn-helix DNA-binding protein, partial [Streptosporangium canum]|uniref:sigma factor-like helix-turn-helix DNA-binding protein n=1 Tax=Streptosporangium canum TaxID=324952 RepID=UPI00344424C8
MAAEALGPLETAEQRDSVSMAFLVLLERLTPAERAVFVLREAFSYGYREIAEVLDLSEANRRQLHLRARRRVGERPRFDAPGEHRRAIVNRFLAAASGGDLAVLEQVLAADVVAWSDGGGLNLGFGLMFAVAAVTLDRLLIRTVSAGYLAFAVPHVCRQSTGCVLAGCYRSSLPACPAGSAVRGGSWRAGPPAGSSLARRRTRRPVPAGGRTRRGGGGDGRSGGRRP